MRLPTTRWWRLTGLLLLIALVSSSLHAHKFYFSVTQVYNNPDSGNLEVTVRLFADDLEKVLAARTGRRIEVDRSPDAESLSFAYLQEVLRLRGPDMQLIPLNWVGLETKVDTVYCYLEAKAPPTGLRNLAIRQGLFFELRRGQVNMVHFQDRKNGRPRDLIFREGDSFKVVIFPEPEPETDSEETKRP
jgi:hypothetical protein